MRETTLLERIVSCSSWTTSEVLGSKVCCIVSLAILDTDSCYLDLEYLFSSDVYLCVDDTSLPLPFSLSSLVLFLRSGQDHSTLRYLAMQCQPSLVDLNLVVPLYESLPLSYIEAFFPVAHQLTDLRLHAHEADPSIPPFLRACTALQHFRTFIVYRDWIDALSVPLVSYAIDCVRSEDVEGLIELIEDGVLGVSKLRRLGLGKYARSKLAGAGGAEGDVLDNWGELAKLCREKGIKIEASDEFVSLTQSSSVGRR